MRVAALQVSDFRNLKEIALSPCDGMNILYGDNAHGKTNLLEAIWLLTGGKSFRGSKDHDLVRFGCERAKVDGTFVGGGREQKASVMIDTRRKVTLNGIPQSSPKKLTGRFCAVIFSPDHLSLIKDGPEERRKFLDAACCQHRPTYMRVLSEYSRLVKQRNQWIKAVKNGEQAPDELLLDAFDERMAAAGAAVRRVRKEYIALLSTRAAAYYNGLSNGREQLSLVYDESDEEATLFAEIKAARERDRKAGFSTVGPHRDDFEVLIGGTQARLYGSQGQQRSAVLALKLAEAALLKENYGENPVILLDDVMSELDSSRQEYILNHIDGFQVFITCCDPTAITRLAGGAVYHIENGTILQQEIP